MSFLVQIVIVLCVVGLLLWVVQQIPMDATIARIIRVVVVVAVCLWLLSLLVGWFGGGAGSGGVFWPRAR
jgi:low temperature requirement protein LtrA